MSSTPALLKKLHTLHRQQVETEREIVDVERQILAAERPATPPRKRSTHAELVAVVGATVKVLRDAGGPLPRKEIASRLGVSPSAAGYRLTKAVELKFAEKVGGGRYQASNVVPAF